MKNTIKLFEDARSIAIIAAILVIGFSMAGCKNDSSSETETYTGTADGVTYTLTITQARFVAKEGDSYVLTVGTNKSSGTVVSFTLETGTFILKADRAEAEEPFTVTVNVDSSFITKITGTITFTDGSKKQGPIELTPPSVNGNNPFKGTWTGQSTISGVTVTLTYIFADTTFERTSTNLYDGHNIEIQARGTYTYTSNTVTPTVTAINYIVDGESNSDGWVFEGEFFDMYAGGIHTGKLSNGKITFSAEGEDVTDVTLTKTD